MFESARKIKSKQVEGKIKGISALKDMSNLSNQTSGELIISSTCCISMSVSFI